MLQSLYAFNGLESYMHLRRPATGVFILKKDSENVDRRNSLPRNIRQFELDASVSFYKPKGEGFICCVVRGHCLSLTSGDQKS